MDAKIAILIPAVKVLVDIIKGFVPNISGRWTQLVVLGLAIPAGIYAAGTTDISALLTAILAVFGGAIAADQVIRRTV